MPENENTVVDLKRFLSTPEKPVDSKEMSEFWTSLTDDEKLEFKSIKLV